MAVVKWSTPGSRSSNLAGSGQLDSLNLDSGRSSAMSYDNSTNLNIYGAITLELGSFSPTVNATVLLRVFAGDGTALPDISSGTSGSGYAGGLFDSYWSSVTFGTGVKKIIFPQVKLYPFPCRFQIQNNTGTNFASSGNALYVTPYGESVS